MLDADLGYLLLGGAGEHLTFKLIELLLQLFENGSSIITSLHFVFVLFDLILLSLRAIGVLRLVQNPFLRVLPLYGLQILEVDLNASQVTLKVFQVLEVDRFVQSCIRPLNTNFRRVNSTEHVISKLIFLVVLIILIINLNSLVDLLF